MHPQTIARALQRAQGGQWLPQELQARRENLRKARVSLSQQTERLTDAYLAAVLPLEEYQRRRLELEQRQQGIAEQARQLEVSVVRHDELAGMVQSIEAFCQQVQQGLAEATFEQKRHLVELLIDRVIVTDEEVEIRYVIPTSTRSEHVRFCHLRLDYFNQPPMPIPVDPLPGLFKRRGGNRGQQDPFQRLLSFGSLLFPHANDPNHHGVLACTRLIAGWQERHLPKGQLHLGRTCLVPMSGGNLERTAGLARPGPCASQSIADLFLALLHTPILGVTHQKVRLGGMARLEEREHIRAPISHMDPQACQIRRTNVLHLTHPDIGFALVALTPLKALFSLRSGNAHKGFLGHAPQHLAGLASARPAPFARKILVRVRCRFVPRR